MGYHITVDIGSGIFMLYKNEFGHHFNLGIDLLECPFLIDKSWKQDMSPSFYFKVDTHYFVLWIDFEEPKEREEEAPRYQIQEASNEGEDNDPEIYATGDIIYSCESPSEILRFLHNLISSTGKRGITDPIQ